MKEIRRWFLLALGWALILVGIVTTPLPTPIGIPLIAVGLAIILANSISARRGFIRLQQRFPETITPIRRLLQRRRIRKARKLREKHINPPHNASLE